MTNIFIQHLCIRIRAFITLGIAFNIEAPNHQKLQTITILKCTQNSVFKHTSQKNLIGSRINI